MSTLAHRWSPTRDAETRVARGIHVAERASNLVFVVALALLGVLVAGCLAGYRPLVEQSGSMRPAIDVGDLLIVRAVPALSVHPGEVVSFKDPSLRGRLVTHRVIAVHSSGGRLQFSTKGDANVTPELWSVAREGTVSVVRARIPALGQAIAWSEDTLARTVVLSLLAFVLSVAALRRVWRP